MITPWGQSQHQYIITEGVYEVDTAGHGGILVRAAIATHLLSKAAIAKGWKWGQWIAYEEDCDWALFAYEQPALYTAAHDAQPGRYKPYTAEEIKQIARDCLSRWHTDYLEQVEGVTP